MSDAAWYSAGALRMLGWTLVHSVWLSALAAGALAVALRAIPPSRAHLRHGFALALLVAVTVGTAALGRHLFADWAQHVDCWESVEHAGPEPVRLPGRCLGHVGSAAAQLASASPPPLAVVVEPEIEEGPGAAAARTLAAAARDLGLAPLERAAAGPTTTASGPLGALTLIWALAAAALLARLAAGLVALARRIRAAEPVRSGEAAVRLGRLAREMGLGRTVGLRTAAWLEAPVVAGWRRPTVLLPRGLAESLSGEELAGILAHELVHVRRSDYCVNLAQRALESTFFFNPFLLWISARVRAEREAVCDREVVRSGAARPRSYVAGLVAAELRRTPRGAPAGVLPHGGGELLGRARRLASGREEPLPDRRECRRLRRRAAAVVVGTVALVLAALPVAYAASRLSSYGVMEVDVRARKAALAPPVGSGSRPPRAAPSASPEMQLP